ncbi:hypothetical protein GCM10023175_32670 [Pseudonocardia xishanensis]|uniref:Choline/carnitine acyltransferase domain-containing protein n=1 Tax=Pseudonocardia xishanensis TaxID=630995 RepID=A0ABP8RSU3_9PSEU
MTSPDADLPRVPLPAPAESVERFLAWCAPLLSPEELAETEKAAADFLAGPAPALHAELEPYAETAESWLDEFWDFRYLGRRDRIALNANFFFLLRLPAADQVARAAALTEAAVDLHLRIREGRVPRPERRGRPLSSVQLPALFGTTRIPGPVHDTVRFADSRHIVVFRRGRLFALDVLDPGGRPLAVADALAGLLSADPAEHPVGPLTTGARAEWAADRAALAAANAEALETVETAPRRPAGSSRTTRRPRPRARWRSRTSAPVRPRSWGSRPTPCGSSAAGVAATLRSSRVPAGSRCGTTT